MPRFIVTVVAAGLLLLLATTGCGSRLNADNLSSFRLGQTTEADVRAAFGKPDMTDERSDGAGVSRVMRWSGEPGTPTFSAVRDLRILVAETYNDRLRGWIFASSAPGADGTKFRRSNVPRIAKGQTTRDEAVRLLGRPAGRASRGSLIPDYKDEFGPGVDEIWAWVHIDNGGAFNGEIIVGELLVKFDASGRVVDVVNSTLKL